MKVRDKVTMYRMLGEGAFGNTIRQWVDLDDWKATNTGEALWGVRSMTPGGPCRLYCPIDEVEATALAFLAQGHRPQFSVMVDALMRVLLWADVWDSPTGLRVYGVENPPKGLSWREGMKRGIQWDGVRGLMMLAQHLNASSLEDLWAVLDRFPGHVVELSAVSRCYGTVPGRNGIVWEVRPGDGSYERW